MKFLTGLCLINATTTNSIRALAAQWMPGDRRQGQNVQSLPGRMQARSQ
jgi:hypothetical protein